MYVYVYVYADTMEWILCLPHARDGMHGSRTMHEHEHYTGTGAPVCLIVAPEPTFGRNL